MIDLQKCYELEQLMLETKHLAEKRIRTEFQVNWGQFGRCSMCGRASNSPILSSYFSEPGISACCHAPERVHRYSPPPDDL